MHSFNILQHEHHKVNMVIIHQQHSLGINVRYLLIANWSETSSLYNSSAFLL